VISDHNDNHAVDYDDHNDYACCTPGSTDTFSNRCLRHGCRLRPQSTHVHDFLQREITSRLLDHSNPGEVGIGSVERTGGELLDFIEGQTSRNGFEDQDAVHLRYI